MGEIRIPLRKKVWRILWPMLIYDGALWLATLVAASVLPVLFRDREVSELLYQSSVAMTLVAGLCALVLLRKEYRSDEGLFPDRKADWNKGQMLLCILGIMSFGHLFNEFLNRIGFTDRFSSYQELAADIYQDQNHFLLILTVGVVSAVCEEIAFRGLIYRRARDFWGIGWGMIISAFLFGIYHGTMVQFVYATVLSFALLWIYELSDQLWLPILGHVAENIWGLYRRQFFAALGENAPSLIGIIWAAEGILLAGVVCFLLREQKKREK